MEQGGHCMESEKVVSGNVHKTPYEMFEQLSQENKEKVIRQIDLLIALQLEDQPEPDSQL